MHPHDKTYTMRKERIFNTYKQIITHVIYRKERRMTPHDLLQPAVMTPHALDEEYEWTLALAAQAFEESL